MRITKNQLRKIINEETDGVLFEEEGAKAVAVADDLLASKDFAQRAEKILKDHPEVMKVVHNAAEETQETTVRSEGYDTMDAADVGSVATGAAMAATPLAIYQALGGPTTLAAAMGGTSFGILAGITGGAALVGLGLALTAYYLQKRKGENE